MYTRALFLLVSIFTANAAIATTTCSRANLTRCLDSVCAINVSSNPAARCQYCGSAGAGTPPSGKAMRSVSVGTSAKYNITDKELKKAPSDPGERYVWATQQCLKKVAGCTADDVSEAYDSLIEQSCRAAGVTIQFNQALEQANKKKTSASCKSDIRACIISDKRCMADFRNCESPSDFDKFFSECSVSATGCDTYIASIRTEIMSDRDAAIKNSDSLLQQIVTSYRNARDKRIATIKSDCAANTSRDSCVETVCAQNMPNRCGDGYESEKSAAQQLCKFYTTACATID